MPRHAGPSVPDCDIHDNAPSIKALYPYLSDYWRDWVEQPSFKGPVDTPYPSSIPASIAPADRGPGTPSASTLDQVRQQVLEPWNVERGILCRS